MKTISINPRSYIALGIVSLFVSFLAASAPHRVHHLFEDLQEASIDGTPIHGSTAPVRHHIHAHPGPLHAGSTHDDHNHDGTTQTVCLLQSAAQHCHVSIVSLFEIASLTIGVQNQSDPPFLTFSHFDPAPFSQRAPPTVQFLLK